MYGSYWTTVTTPTSWGGVSFILYACATTHTQLSRPITSGHFTFVEFGLPKILHLLGNTIGLSSLYASATTIDLSYYIHAYTKLCVYEMRAQRRGPVDFYFGLAPNRNPISLLYSLREISQKAEHDWPPILDPKHKAKNGTRLASNTRS